MKHLESSAHEYRVVPLEVRRSSKARARPLSFSLKIPVTTILVVFFPALFCWTNCSLLAWHIWQLFTGAPPPAGNGQLLEYRRLRLLGGRIRAVIYPYYAATLLVWLVGVNQKMRQKNSYWVFWLLVSFLLVRAPLTIRWLGSSYPMIWFSALSEAVIAVAAYSMFSVFAHKKRSYALDVKEFQAGLLLTAIFLGTDLMVYQFPLRILIMFYLVLAAARVGQAGLALLVGPMFTLICLLLKLPLELSVLVAVVSVIAGFTAHLPFGLLFASLAGYLLAFGVPVKAETVQYLIMLTLAAVAIYLTPSQRLRQLERLLPGRKVCSQASFHAAAQEILETRWNSSHRSFKNWRQFWKTAHLLLSSWKTLPRS